MAFPKTTDCCGCARLETGAKIIGWFEAIISLASLILLAYITANALAAASFKKTILDKLPHGEGTVVIREKLEPMFTVPGELTHIEVNRANQIKLDEVTKETLPNIEAESTTHKRLHIITVATIFCSIPIAISALKLCFAFCLLAGVKQRNSCLIKIWLFPKIIMLVLGIGLAFIISTGMKALGVILAGFALECYCIWVVYSYMCEIKY